VGVEVLSLAALLAAGRLEPRRGGGGRGVHTPHGAALLDRRAGPLLFVGLAPSITKRLSGLARRSFPCTRALANNSVIGSSTRSAKRTASLPIDPT
jgi:hypothetical protein